MKISKDGLDLIKEFEGLRLEAYLCASGVPTIGWGHTSNVQMGDKITEEEAEKYLLQDLESFEQCVNTWVNVKISQSEFDALVSFSFNVGCTALSTSTLLRKLNDKFPRKEVANEFDRWVKGVGGVTLEGLVRRREAEKQLFLQKSLHPLLGKSILAKQDTWLKKRAADSTHLKPEEKLFVPEGSAWEWYSITMFAGSKHFSVKLAADQSVWYFYEDHWKIINDVPDNAVTYNKSSEVNLDVPYYSQRDNYRDADRTCYSSSCAMLLSYLRPEAISNDDDYIRVVFDLGDTTEAFTQLSALETYGVKADFRQNGTFEDIEELLRKDIPVPIGILHRGTVEHPSGGGHWIVVRGITADGKGFYVNDPYGELDLLNGTYPSYNGNNLIYSKKNLKSRWMPEGSGSGWYILAKSW